MALVAITSILILTCDQISQLSLISLVACVCRAHALELGNAVPKTSPLLFLKPTSSYLAYKKPSNNSVKDNLAVIKLPKGATVHHEVELGLIIGRKCSNVPLDKARQYIKGVTLSLDMTARSYQREAQAKGEPWTLAKCWDTFCPTSTQVLPMDSVADIKKLRLWCSVNGEKKQDALTGDMIFGVDELVSYVSSVMTLEPGDLILTGTPAGVGPLEHGQVIECGMECGVTGRQLDHIKFLANEQL